jgi:hypothetical protein
MAPKAPTNFKLAYFITLVEEKKHAPAIEVLLYFLKHIESGNTLGHISNTEHHSEEEVTHIYTLFATNIIALFKDDNFIMTEAIYYKLILYKRIIETVFQLSNFTTTDSILVEAKLIDFSTQALRFNSLSDLYKILLFVGLNSLINLDYRQLLPQAKMPALAAYFAQLSNNIFLNNISHKKYLSLFQQIDIIDMVDHLENTAFMSLLGIIWMRCSYLPQTDKHVIKFKINCLIQRTWKKWDFNINKGTNNIVKKKPCMIIVADVFQQNHAMYRSFARAFKDLSKNYDLVAVTEHGKIDATAKKLFTKVIENKSTNYDFVSLLAQIRSVNPDIIFYPSIGMSNLGIWLANLRLAPIQISGLGHPASSFSSAIDYLLMEEGLFHPLAPVSEKVILLPNGSYEYTNHVRLDIAQHQEFIGEETSIQIAVPCNSLKITMEFLLTCQEIQNATSKKIHFHFFPNLQGAFWHLVKRMINNILPDATVHHTSKYDIYFNNLTHCDFAISTFPFGGCNSTHDALQSGLPLITLEGVETHSKSDSYFLRYLEVDNRLITTTRENFKQMVLTLIEDEKVLSELRDHVKSLSFEKLIKDIKTESNSIFAEVFTNLHKNHDKILSSEMRVWPHSAISVFDTTETN